MCIYIIYKDSVSTDEILGTWHYKNLMFLDSGVFSNSDTDEIQMYRYLKEGLFVFLDIHRKMTYSLFE